MINMSFWVASLWADLDSYYYIASSGVFALLWAIVLIGVLIFGTKKNIPFLVNMTTTFGAIHFYTQYFEFFDVNPVSMIISGIIGIFITVILWKYNKK